MEQTMQSNNGKRIQGSLLIVGAIAVGVGSGLGLNFFLPHRGDPMSAAAQTEEQEASEQTESSASESTASASDTAVPAPSSAVAETAESTTPPAESTESATASSEAESPASEPAAEAPSPSSGASEVAAAEPASPTNEAGAEPMASEPTPAAAAPMPKKAKRAAPPPAAQVLRSWWSSTAADPFAVEYVGQVQGQRAIAILFSRDVSDPAGNLKLIGADGKALDGGWKAGNSPRLLVRSDLKPGRYTVMIEQQLASADGQSLRVPLRGPIYIQ